MELANLPRHPESVPINMLVKVAGTPMANEEDLDPFEFIRTIAAARLMMPQSYVRLSAGREAMNEQMQALAFMAGANSIFYCYKLLTTANPKANTDMQLFSRLGIKPESFEERQAPRSRRPSWCSASTRQKPIRCFIGLASANNASYGRLTAGAIRSEA